MSGGSATIRVVHSEPDMRELESNGEAGAMLLLYLNQDTWIEQGEALERDVRATQSFTQEENPIGIILVHENDKRKGGCEFGNFFGTTPPGLIEEGIYKDVAIALHTAPHRAVSLALVAQALGATKASKSAASYVTMVGP